MIFLNDAITNGTWFHCEFKRNIEVYQFRLKILSFQKLDITLVDEPEKIKMENGTIIWLMEAEMINLSKEPISSSGAIGFLNLVNQNGLTYRMSFDSHLSATSEFAKKRRLLRFNIQALIPKIKAVGAIIFRLPANEDDAVYSLSMRNGSIREA